MKKTEKKRKSSRKSSRASLVSYPLRSKDDSPKVLVVTHGSNYHADDLFAVAVVSMYLKSIGYNESGKANDKGKKIVIKRSLDPAVHKKADILLDIGLEYDPETMRFDHHQLGGAGHRENGIPYATFGLVWKHFGKKICGSDTSISSNSLEAIVEYVDKKLVCPMDASDNGVDTFRSLDDRVTPVLLDDYIDAECILEKNKSTSEQNFDRSFKKLLPFAERVILLYIEKAKSYIEAKKKIDSLYKRSDYKDILVSDQFIPFDFEDLPQILFYVYKDLRGNWSAKSIRNNSYSYDNRKSFPVEWRGKRDKELADISEVEDAIFCHNSGFLSVSKSKAGAIKLAQKAILS
jgi:uncharacterized UPF0160 family protein